MAVEEQTSEVATAPSSDSFTLAVGRHTAEKRQAPDGDVAGGDFGDLGELEAVHVPGGVLPEPVPNAHCVIVECNFLFPGQHVNYFMVVETLLQSRIK